MEVHIVDSENGVAALIDCLECLPTQPPSLYLDIEGVRLSRHGSISIIQLLVLPQNYIFLIDVFLLKEAAFSTTNDAGTSLRSILESAQVPKVFFDVRNDSDALFAHFQISLQAVHDVQLLELATYPYLRKRVHGLGACIERDAQLAPQDLAVWKATKHRGHLYFVPEHGGSYEVFNFRPMLQDIVDYCTQDVVYLPVLWEIYTQKLSAKWMKKVLRESRERIVASQKASYEPEGRHKALSPWGKSAKSGRGMHQGSDGAGGPERETMTAVVLEAAIKAARKAAITQPDTKTDPEPSAGPEAGLRPSARLAAREAAKNTSGLEGPLSRLDLSMEESGPWLKSKTNPVVKGATIPSSWTCVLCSREIQHHQKEEHLAGNKHFARVKRTPALQTNTPKGNPLGTMVVNKKSPQSGVPAAQATPRKTKRGPAKDPSAKRKKGHAAAPQSPGIGSPYPPDHQVHGFQGAAAGPGNHQYVTVSLWHLLVLDYSACDNDCGWCGYCMDDIGF